MPEETEHVSEQSQISSAVNDASLSKEKLMFAHKPAECVYEHVLAVSSSALR